MSSYAQPFDAIRTPGGYTWYVYEYQASARRTVSPTISGDGVATHLGYEQKKVMMIFWHPVELDIESLINAQEVDGYVRSGAPKTTSAVHPTVNLFNTEVEFQRYLREKPQNTTE